MKTMEMMRTVVIAESGRAEPGQIAKPEVKDGEVLLRIRRVGFCGSDLNTFRGLNPLVEYPRVPGHEIGGEIVAKGEGVPETLHEGVLATVLPYTTCGKCSACLKGRPNACRSNQTLGVQRDGALTEYFTVPWEKVLVSQALDAEGLALVEPLSVGFHAVSRAAVEESQTVGVIGTGMIGLGVVASAGLRAGARVIAIDVDNRKLELARKAGAAETINSATEDLHARLSDLTDGEGPDVMIEAVGLVSTFKSCVEEVAYGGRVVYIGYAKQPVEYETKWFLLKELDVMGSRNATKADFLDVMDMLENDERYPVAETVTSVVPMERAGEALAEWAANPAEITKIQVEL